MPKALSCFPGICLIVLLLFVVVPSSAAAQDRQMQEHINKALDEIKQSIQLSQERTRQLRKEVEQLQKDQKKLIEALAVSAFQERSLRHAAQKTEAKFKDLLAKKTQAEQVLAQRRRDFGDGLAMLEKMALRPPPALLIEADDALKSLRSSILLGSVVIQLREQTQALTATLTELSTLEETLKGEKNQLIQNMTAQKEEEQRLELLLVEKARLQQQVERDFGKQEEDRRKLEQKAQSLSELMQELEQRAASQNSAPENATSANPPLAFDSDFTRLRGALILPVEGNKVQNFDQNFPGELYETAPNSLIIAPAEGLVRYAGFFRSYGQMLILDVGQNYHLILAGMGRLDVKMGQIVLEGEPVGVMGNSPIPSQEKSDAIKTIPTLYIELRKDAMAIDPGPWWSQ